MKPKTKQPDEPSDPERFRLDLARKLDRLVAEAIDGWATCGNQRCRRARGCASDRRECIAKWGKSLPPRSPGEIAEGMAELKKMLDARKAGVPLDALFAQATAPLSKAATAANAAAPVPEATPLAPEQAERVDRIWNDDLASMPAEEDGASERGPRITQL